VDDEIKANLAASLLSTTAELSEVVRELANLSTDKEIELHAETLDHLANNAREGAAILRAALATRRRLRPSLPRRIRGAANRPRIPHSRNGDAS
jgi:hypothetical protein